MEILQKYSWPGNIRELENVVKSLMITNVSEVITKDALPHNLLREAHSQNLKKRWKNWPTKTSYGDS